MDAARAGLHKKRTAVGECVQVLSTWKNSVEDLRIPQTAVWGWFKSTRSTFVKMKTKQNHSKANEQGGLERSLHGRSCENNQRPSCWERRRPRLAAARRTNCLIEWLRYLFLVRFGAGRRGRLRYQDHGL